MPPTQCATGLTLWGTSFATPGAGKRLDLRGQQSQRVVAVVVLRIRRRPLHEHAHLLDRAHPVGIADRNLSLHQGATDEQPVDKPGNRTNALGRIDGVLAPRTLALIHDPHGGLALSVELADRILSGGTGRGRSSYQYDQAHQTQHWDHS